MGGEVALAEAEVGLWGDQGSQTSDEAYHDEGGEQWSTGQQRAMQPLTHVGGDQTKGPDSWNTPLCPPYKCQLWPLSMTPW